MPKYCILSDLMCHIVTILFPTTYNLIQYNTLSRIIHNAIIYYTPYNYISIMYISYCYHISIIYYIINYIIVYHTMQSNILLLCIVFLYIISICIQAYMAHNTHIKNIPVHKYRLETYFIILNIVLYLHMFAHCYT